MSKRVYGSYVDRVDVRHFASGVPSERRPADWDTYLFCKGWVTAKPDVGNDRDVTCLRCVAKWCKPFDAKAILRGQSADLVYYDEVGNYHTQNPCAEIDLTPVLTKP